MSCGLGGEKGKRREQKRESMETKSLAFMVLVMVAVAGGMWEVKMAGAAPSDAQCKQEITLGVNACAPAVISGDPPTPECCQRARVTHFECVCPKVTPKIAAVIDLKRILRLLEGCGRKVPRHYKCGSITTP